MPKDSTMQATTRRSISASWLAEIWSMASQKRVVERLWVQVDEPVACGRRPPVAKASLEHGATTRLRTKSAM